MGANLTRVNSISPPTTGSALRTNSTEPLKTFNFTDEELRELIKEYSEHFVCITFKKARKLRLDRQKGKQRTQSTRCKVCNEQFSGVCLRATVTSPIEVSKKRAVPCSPEAGDESLDDGACTTDDQDVASLFEHNAPYLEASRSLQERNTFRLAKVETLTENNSKLTDKVEKLTRKMEELLVQINKPTTNNNSASDPKRGSNQQSTTDRDPDTPAQPVNDDDNSAPTIPGHPSSATSTLRNTPLQPALSCVNVAQKGLSALPSRLQARLK